jgi:hypothetical protein
VTLDSLSVLLRAAGALSDGGGVTVNVNGGASSALAAMSIDELRSLAALGVDQAVDQAPVIALPAQGDDARTC